jgi:hypothetical protein
VRNEERTIEQSLQSLKGLTIPHEIIVVLHLCTDRSNEIVEHAGVTRIFEYQSPISRAGYETLVTNTSSTFSLMSYYNWCFEKTHRLWSFKWDADHIATAGLIDFLNSRSWDDPTPTRIRVPAITPNAKPNPEPFLFNAGNRHTKHVFWEHNAAVYDPHVREEICPATIEHASPLDEPFIKTYWRAPAWFEHHDSAEAAELRRRLQLVVQMFGAEPVGMARACNPAADALYRAVRERERDLLALGINLWQ